MDSFYCETRKLRIRIETVALLSAMTETFLRQDAKNVDAQAQVKQFMGRLLVTSLEIDYGTPNYARYLVAQENLRFAISKLSGYFAKKTVQPVPSPPIANSFYSLPSQATSKAPAAMAQATSGPQNRATSFVDALSPYLQGSAQVWNAAVSNQGARSRQFSAQNASTASAAPVSPTFGVPVRPSSAPGAAPVQPQPNSPAVPVQSGFAASAASAQPSPITTASGTSALPNSSAANPVQSSSAVNITSVQPGPNTSASVTSARPNSIATVSSVQQRSITAASVMSSWSKSAVKTPVASHFTTGSTSVQPRPVTAPTANSVQPSSTTKPSDKESAPPVLSTLRQTLLTAVPFRTRFLSMGLEEKIRVVIAVNSLGRLVSESVLNFVQKYDLNKAELVQLVEKTLESCFQLVNVLHVTQLESVALLSTSKPGLPQSSVAVGVSQMLKLDSRNLIYRTLAIPELVKRRSANYTDKEIAWLEKLYFFCNETMGRFAQHRISKTAHNGVVLTLTSGKEVHGVIAQILALKHLGDISLPAFSPQETVPNAPPKTIFTHVAWPNKSAATRSPLAASQSPSSTEKLSTQPGQANPTSQDESSEAATNTLHESGVQIGHAGNEGSNINASTEPSSAVQAKDKETEATLPGAFAPAQAQPSIAGTEKETSNQAQAPSTAASSEVSIKIEALESTAPAISDNATSNASKSTTIVADTLKRLIPEKMSEAYYLDRLALFSDGAPNAQKLAKEQEEVDRLKPQIAHFQAFALQMPHPA